MPPRDQYPVNIGDKAEDDFVSWCTNNGLLATKANRDRMGWDYFVEVPAIHAATRSADDPQHLIKALCQIKGTRRASEHNAIKLSALKNLIDADLPSYIIFIIYDKCNLIQAASILHIGPEIIESVLRDIVICQSKGRAAHTVTMRLPLAEARPLAIDGTSLVDEIRRHIVTDTADYIVRKDKFRKSCGYDSTSVKGRFSLAAGVAPSEFFDLFTGENSSVRISEFSISKSRFGVEKSHENIGSCILSIQPNPIRDATIRLVNKEAHLSSEMKVSVYSAPFPNLPSELRKVRLKNEFLDVLIKLGSENATVELSIPDRLLSLSDLSNVVKFASLLGMRNTEMQIRFTDNIPEKVGILEQASEFTGWGALSEFLQIISVALFKHRPQAAVAMSIQDAWACFNENIDNFSILVRPGLGVRMTLLPHDVVPRRRSAILIVVREERAQAVID